MNVGELIAKDGDGAGEDADRVQLAVAQVDQLADVHHGLAWDSVRLDPERAGAAVVDHRGEGEQPVSAAAV